MFLGCLSGLKVKRTFFAVAVAILILVLNSGLQAVNTRGIERVRNNEVLDSGDFQVIDSFVAEAVEDLLYTQDFGKARAVILQRNSSSKPSAQAQYAEKFYESAHKHISLVLKRSSQLTPEERRFKVILNLLILIDGLEDLRLADLAMGMLNNENPVIRYWAVHSLTNAGIIEQLNSPESGNSGLAGRIAKNLGRLVEKAEPEVVALIADFAAGVNVRQGEDLLGLVADVRIKKYAEWDVEYELLDAMVLKRLYGKMSSNQVGRVGIARRFAQLYSYAIQRYMKGGDSLSAVQKQRLASVLVETEKSCFGEKPVGMPQSRIRRAVEGDDMAGLLAEHNRLLGGGTGAGQLPLKLKFDYGRGPDGSKRTAPLALPEPPRSKSGR